jgi:microcystin-dependent protein
MDITQTNWNESDASNSTAAPDGAPEGMAPSGVNDVLRAHQGALKRWYNWSIPKLTAGTSTAYALTYSVAPGALVDGMTHLVEFHTTNGAAPTLNVNALGAVPLYYYSYGAWRALPASLFGANALLRVAYHASSGVYRLIGREDRTGVIEDFAGATAPAGTLLCYGQAISRTTYAGLFAALGTAHGAGDGSTTFNLPDLRDRATIGKGDMGGPAANRITSAVSGIDTTVLGVAGGAQSKTANVSSIPVTGTASGTMTGGTGGPDAVNAAAAGSAQPIATDGHGHSVSVSGTLTLTASASGTSSAFSVVQPGAVVNKIIRI